jgi:hypothetical protein
MRHKLLIIILAALIVPAFGLGSLVFAGDLDDGISKFKDDSISANDKIGKPETNINFIVLESMAEAQKRQKAGDKNANLNDGSGDNNQNSVVCEVGAKCDKVININIGKP